MGNEFRLSDEEVRKHYLGSRLSAIHDLLDAQIESLFSSFPTPEKLKDEIRKIFASHSNGYQQAMDEGCETDDYSGIDNNDGKATAKLSELFQLYSLSLVQEAVKKAKQEVRERFIEYLDLYGYSHPDDSWWQALKEGGSK